MASFLDKFMDTNKSSKMTVISPRKAFEDVLKQASGSAYTRALKYNIYYQIYAFYGIVDGIGTSTLVANTALGIAEAGLTVCVIDTSILAPVQDVLLNTNEAVLDENSQDTEHFDWFDMPFMKTSPLHVSKKNKNISVLSFKGKRRGVIDFLSTNDSDSLAEIALTTLHNKFDIILIDCCHEMSAVNTACLQQAQQVIQVWNDSPTVLANLENFITNSITLSCALDKMRYVVGNRLSKDAIGSLDDLCKQYRCKLLTTNYLSEELYLLAVTGKTLFRVTSTDDLVINYTESVIEVICHILNIDLTGKKPKGTISSNEIMNGVVEGTLHKELKDFNDEFSKEHPDVLIDTNPIGGHSGEQMQLEEDMAVTEETDLFSSKAVDSVMSEDAPVDENEQREMQAEVDALNYGGVIAEDDIKPEELVDNDGNGVPDIMENPERKKKKSLFGKQKNKGNKK
jgi:cellulose biosynthesis protein BcsQ